MLGLMKKVIPRTHVREGWKEFMGSVHSPDSASPCITLKLLVVHVHDTYICIYFFFVFFSISWAAPVAYGDSQARGLIGARATGLCQSHSNTGSEPCLQPTPQLMATPDRPPTEQGQGSNPHPHGS